jgi:hypothetical protein
MNARSPLSHIELAEQRLSRRPVALPRPPVALALKPDQPGFYRWLLGWFVITIAVVCIRLALMSWTMPVP